jgi:hypothetical protein
VQAISTVTGLQTTLDAKADSSSLTAHTGNTSNPHSTTKSQVGLGNVDNTSDANKPVSTAQQTALNLKAPIASPVFTGTVSTSGTIIRLGTTGIMASLITEAANTIIDFGVNYFQTGSRVDASRGAYFRIDTRDSNVAEVFSVTVQEPGTSNPAETKILRLSTGGLLSTDQMSATNGAPSAASHLTRKDYVDSAVATKQSTLVSGTNIKTINGNSLLGSGNIVISGGGGGSGDVVGPPSATDNAIVRFDTTTGKLVQDSLVTVDDSGKIQTPGIGLGKSPSANKIEILNSSGTQGFRVESPASSDIAFSTYVTGDSFVRGTFLTNGRIELGDGTAVADTNLYRSAANTLKTDDNFIANNIASGATISGANTGDQTSVSGNAGTATTLATARTIGTLTGDVTTAGSTFNGSANNTNATVLATVNSNVGTFGSASAVNVQTVNAKGLTTAASSVAIQIAQSQVTNLTTDLAAKQSAASIAANGMGVCVHGATAGTARPTGFAQITWIGSVAPTNAVTNDIWYNG